jgi:hypothetical protein
LLESEILNRDMETPEAWSRQLRKYLPPPTLGHIQSPFQYALLVTSCSKQQYLPKTKSQSLFQFCKQASQIRQSGCLDEASGTNRVLEKSPKEFNWAFGGWQLVSSSERAPRALFFVSSYTPSGFQTIGSSSSASEKRYVVRVYVIVIGMSLTSAKRGMSSSAMSSTGVMSI